MDFKENPLPLPEKKLNPLVKRTRHYGVEQLEKYLGIRFSRIPNKVKVRGLNKLPLNIFHPGLMERIHNTAKNAEGIYRSEYDTFFSKFTRSPNKDESMDDYFSEATMDRHESMHAYIDALNPKMNARYQLRHGGSSFSVPLEKTKLEYREKEELYRVMNEGIADWAAFETILMEKWAYWKKEYERIYQAQKTTTSKRILDALIDWAGNNQSVVDGVSVENINKNYDAVMQVLFRQWRELIGSDNIDRRYWEKLLSFRFIIGRHFVNEVMRNLRLMGVSTADALDLIIKNPPDSLEKVKNPQAFAEGLKKSARVIDPGF